MGLMVGLVLLGCAPAGPVPPGGGRTGPRVLGDPPITDPDGWDGGPPPRYDYDATCDRIAVEARAEAVHMMVVLDRSGSMYDFEPGGDMIDRWRPSVSAIESVTAALEDRIGFGLLLFGSDDICGAGTVRVHPGMMNAAAIRSELAGDPRDVTGGGTPTAASLRVAQRELAALPGQKYVLLVTDGAPNCNMRLDPDRCRCTYPGGGCIDGGECLDDAGTLDAVRSLREAGIPTFVIGYDTGMWADVMDRMATEGGTGLTRHIPVRDGASLETALRDIGGSVVSCSYDLSMPPGDVHYVRVTIDGTDVPHETVASGGGWRLEGDRTITLYGSVCDNVQDGEPHHIDVAVECEPVIF